MNASHEIYAPGQGKGRALERVGSYPVGHSDRLDLSDSVSFFRKRLGLIGLVTLAALIIGAAVSFLSDKEYDASSVVSMVSPPNETATTGETATAGPQPNNAYVDTQIEIIESREMAQRVASALGLLSGQDVAGQNRVVDRLQRNVDVERSGESFALKINVRADTGEGAAERANAYANQFTNWELDASKDRTQDSIETISSRLAELRQQAQSDTAALQQYRIANNLLSTSGSSLTEQEISSYNQAVTSARAEAAEDEARLQTALSQLRSGSSGDDVGEALGSSVVSSLRQREADLTGQVAALSSRYGANHPELIRAKDQLSDVRGQIQAEIERVISNLRAKRNVSQQRLASLNGSLASAKGQLSQNNSAMVGLDELQRNADVSQGLYETYLNSYKQLVAREGTERPNAQVLTLAQAPSLPSSPNIPMNMVLALIIGLGAGIAAAFLAETLFSGVATADDIRQKTNLPFLGSVPLLGSVSKGSANEVRAITSEPRGAFAESFRSLRASIEQTVFGPTDVLAITSALPREGKTITSTCLAQTIAIGGETVVLIDCDHIRSGVTKLLSLDPEHPGLFQLLDKSRNLDEVMISDASGLNVIPMGFAPQNAESLLDNGAFEALLNQLKLNYDQIVLDLPPVLPVAAARIIASYADATIMTVRWRKTAGPALQSAVGMMENHAINLGGVAMTQVDYRKKSLFGANDPVFYFGDYRSYYT